ncbi:GNAT family acetyltransferase [Bacillus australimaris]|uniref:GNAT family N-acetyltransferase n=1 Tax=Bacillus australimaris TaxID=1326968 RepID=A0ABD4QNV6_9BACI|nr:GNAT family N-acetyltransferase [Bacillus australimaris]KPN13088.1 GNAT family acetyltransferase [Bacillus australimaris]MBR8691025.1 GNAT family N-acetyltransferase [Bacillus australimaris]
METYELVSDYRHDHKLKESFNQLAINTFDLDFSDWYKRGYWDEKYIPYSFVHHGKVVSNASVYLMSVIIDGQTYRAVQIGTVMTDQAYRHKGLATKLIQHIMDQYENDCDMIFLFANDSVLNFYPRFGFTRYHESEFCLDINKSTIQMKKDVQLKQLTLEQDLPILEQFAEKRQTGSMTLNAEDHGSLLMFYFTLVWPDAIFYIETLDTIVLMNEENETMHVFDMISLQTPNVEEVVASIVKETTEKVIFYFTPDTSIDGLHAVTTPNDEDALFIYTKKDWALGHFMFPITAHC